MRSTFALLLAALALPAFAESPIRLPKLPEPAVPMPAPDARLTLTSETLYVIDSDVPLIVLTSPAGVVGKTEDAGPIRIKGKFADAPGKFETRMFTGKHVVTIEPVKSGAVELLIVPSGATKEADVIRRLLDVNDGTKPIPPPVPPTPEPAKDFPFKGVTKLHVMMVYPAFGIPEAQYSAMFGDEVGAYLASHTDGTNRRWKSNTDVSTAPQAFKDAWARKKGDSWIAIGNGKDGYEGPLPADTKAMMELLRKYGGE